LIDKRSTDMTQLARLQELARRLDQVVTLEAKTETPKGKRGRAADIATAGVIGGVTGGAIGRASGGFPSLKSIKKYDPFSRFRPGKAGEEVVDYGSTLGIAHSGDIAQDIGGEQWKIRPGRQRSNGAKPFQTGVLTEAEKAARKTVQAEYRVARRGIKRGLIGAGIGAAALGAPFLKKPYASSSSREQTGKVSGAAYGSLAGLGVGALAGIASARNPINVGPALGVGLLGGSIAGGIVGKRLGGGIGARIKRRESRKTPK
jgi:uncharacterized membrane protein YfcA